VVEIGVSTCYNKNRTKERGVFMDDLEMELLPYNPNDYVSKSNYLISAKHNSSLLENQLLLLSLQRIQPNSKGQLISKISTAEVKQLLGKDYGEFYTQLRRTAVRMLNNVIMIEDPETKSFHASNIITDAKSKDGDFTVIFNPNMKDVIVGLKQNFTKLNLPIMRKFESVISFRLYELLRSRCYYPKGTVISNMDNKFRIEFGLAELKFTFGAVDLSNPRISDTINNKTTPDYEKALNDIRKMAEKDPYIKKPKYENWRDFKRCLEKAINELNEVSDIRVSYDVERKGQGGKVNKIVFIVKILNSPSEEIENPLPAMSEEEKIGYVMKADKILESNLSVKDLTYLLETADYDLEKLKKAYELSKQQSEIHNLTGWLAKAIEEGFEKPVSKKGKKKNNFTNFQQNDYDYDALEKELLEY